MPNFGPRWLAGVEPTTSCMENVQIGKHTKNLTGTSCKNLSKYCGTLASFRRTFTLSICAQKLHVYFFVPTVIVPTVNFCAHIRYPNFHPGVCHPQGEHDAACSHQPIRTRGHILGTKISSHYMESQSFCAHGYLRRVGTKFSSHYIVRANHMCPRLLLSYFVIYGS